MWGLFAAVIALTVSFGALPDATTGDSRVAFDPNLSVDHCQGGHPIAVTSGAFREFGGSFIGAREAFEAFGYDCTGYYEQAQFCFSVTSTGELYTFEIVDAGGADTTLALVRDGADWPICDDDGGSNLLSRISQYLEPGEYLVYVGAFSQGVAGSFTLQVSRGSGY